MIKKIKMNNDNVPGDVLGDDLDDVPELYIDPEEQANSRIAFHHSHLLFEIITAMPQSTQQEILEKFEEVLQQELNNPSFCNHCIEFNYH